MYTTTRNIAGGTLMTCKDCGHAISMNKICEKPIQAATDILKHMAAHNASRAFAAVGRVTPPEKEAFPSTELPPPTLGIPAPVDGSALPLTH
jgi:hypothetical protein